MDGAIMQDAGKVAEKSSLQHTCGDGQMAHSLHGHHHGSAALLGETVVSQAFMGSSSVDVDTQRVVEEVRKGNTALLTATDSDGNTLLHHKVLAGRLPPVELLINLGSQVNSPNHQGLTPVHLAASRGHPMLLHLLRTNGAVMNQRDREGQTVLHHAAKNGHIHAICYLTEVCDLPFNCTDNNGRNLLHIACQGETIKRSTVEYLLKKERVSPSESDNEGVTPLHMASAHGDPLTCHMMMVARRPSYELSLADRMGRTPVDLARGGSSPGHKEVVELYTDWLSKGHAYTVPVTFRPLIWYVELLASPVLVPMCIAAAAVLTPYSQGWLGLLAMVFWVRFCIIVSHRINHWSRLASPARVGGIMLCLFSPLIHTLLYMVPHAWDVAPIWTAVCVVQTIISFGFSMLLLTADPGFVSETKRSPAGKPYTMSDLVIEFKRPFVWCSYCELIAPKPSKHCKLCERCCHNMDHHCLYLLSCVGWKTQWYFYWTMGLFISLQISYMCFLYSYLSSLISSDPSIFPAQLSREAGISQPGFSDIIEYLWRFDAWSFVNVIFGIQLFIFCAAILLFNLPYIAVGYTAIFAPKTPGHRSGLSWKQMGANIAQFFLNGRVRHVDPAHNFL